MIRAALAPKKLLSLAAAFFFAGLMVVTALPQTVFAADESFVWHPTDNSTINVSGGDVRPSTIKTTAVNGNNFYGTLTHETGCTFKVQILLGFNGSGTISFPTSAGSGGGGGDPNACNVDLIQPFRGQRVQVTGTRAAPSGAETEPQRGVAISLYSPDPFGTAIPNVSFTFQQNGQVVTLPVTSAKTAVWLGTGDLPAESERAAMYTGHAKLNPGTYQVCFSAIITECQTFTKVLYYPFAKSYGTPYQTGTVNKDIGVTVEITYTGTTGEGRTIGPLNITLQNEAGQVVKTVASSSFTTESCDPGDLTPTPTCQSPGQTMISTTTLRATLDNVEPGNYKVCVAGTTTCQNVTKVLAQDASVTLVANGQAGQDIANSTGTSEEDDSFCDNFGALGWALCPVAQAIIDAINGLDQWILDHILRINTGDIFGTASSSQAFKTAWGIFRNIAYALFIILGLIMIISQIMGLDIFDAYTIRKMLPKLVAAAIFIPLLWPLLRIVFEMANDSGAAVYELILAPFGGVGNEVSLAALFSGAALTAGAGAALFFAVGGWGVFFAAVLSVLLALLSALVILAARDIVAYTLIIGSPIAVICATFEPFKKVFTFWKTFLLTILLSLPAVAAVLAASKVAAKIAISASQNAGDNVVEKGWGILLAALFLAAGYALFWKIFQQLDKVSGQIGNLAGNLTGKAQKALSDYRGNTLKKRWNEGIEGRKNLGFFGAGNMLTGLGRRARMTEEAGLGAWGVGKKGRSKYAEAVKTMQAGVAAKMMEQDHDRAGGDDDAMRLLARRGMTESRFLKEYSALQRAGGATEEQAAQRARSALGLSQTSLGARAGTSAMRIAAQKSLLKSNTSYGKGADGKYLSYGEMTRQVYGDVAELVQDGLISVADGAAMIKSNSARADRAGVGFGMSIKQLDRVAREGVGALDTKAVNDMADDALRGTGPYQLAGQRHEGIGILAPQMTRRIQESWDQAAWDDRRELSPAFIQQIAAAASRRDMAGQFPELNAGINADEVEARQVGGGLSTQQWEEYLRQGAPSVDQATFQRYRREYSSALAASLGAAAGPPGTGPPGLGGPPGP